MNSPNRPTPDSDILWSELLDVKASPEMAAYEVALEACHAAKNNDGFVKIMKEICDRAVLHLDFAPQVRELRFAVRDQSLAANRIAKALHALSEKIGKIVNEE
jgi:phytoene/squalene synthetase